MRAGAYKLLVASTKREQILDAAKSLLTCNARIKAYMTEAQRRKEQGDVPERLIRRSDMVCSYITVAGECVSTCFMLKSYVVGICDGFSGMSLFLPGPPIHRTACLARAKLP